MRVPWFRRRRRKPVRPPPTVPAEPMVDRRLELDVLRGHLTTTLESGHGHAVVLLGDSGVGKSRLAAELAAEARQRKLVVITTRGVGRGAEPLLPVKDALRDHLGHSPAKVRRTLVSASPRLLDAIPFIGAFLGKVGESIIDRQQFRGASLDGIYEELSRLLLAISERHGLCLVVEDLHDVDKDTLYFVNYLLGKIRDWRVLVLVTVQNEGLREAPDLRRLLARWSTDGYAAVAVTPLERAHVGEYARSVLALGAEPDERLIDRVFRLTGGNPFYLKETLRILAEPGRDAQFEEAELRLPPHVTAVVQERLARADGDTRRLLDAVAVIADGSQGIEPTRWVMDESEAAAVMALRQGCRLGLLVEGVNGEISFAHDILRLAVYGELGATARRYMHGRAAVWFDTRGQPATAASHFEIAGHIPDMIRASLQAAANAEQQGLYHSALFLYQKARPHMAIEDIGPRLVHALVTLGDWPGAEEVIARLPAGGGTALLRSELAFVRGDFHGARQALGDPGVDRVRALHRVADIELYLGNFAEARRWAQQARQAADGARIPLALLCALLGAVAYFSDDLDGAEATYREGLDLLVPLPAGERDVLVEMVLRGNLANVALTRGDIAVAAGMHEAVLKKRREVADARGALHSMHGLALCRLRAGDAPAALELLEQTDQLAAGLGETLERAKVAQTRGTIALDEGDAARGYELIRGALESFERSQCRYDITHARTVLSRAAAAVGREREAVELAAVARATAAVCGFGLLRRSYPEIMFSVADRVAGALTAYACGDALGLPYETYPPRGPSGASAEQIETVHARAGWELGSTSDDTALTLLVARHLVDTAGEGSAEAFLGLLGEHAPEIRGLGPSTTRAVRQFAETGQIGQDSAGNTNGAAMRALPAGWVAGIGDRDRLQRLVIELSRPTHRSPDAVIAACVLAECAAWAVEGASPALLLEIAAEAAARATENLAGTPSVTRAIAEVVDGTWTVPDHGPSMEPGETTGAVLHSVRTARSLRAGLLTAIGLGGDSDTVAALTGGLLGAGLSRDEVLTQLPYATQLRLPSAADTSALAAGLVVLRNARCAS